MEGKREKVAVLYWLFYDVLFFLLLLVDVCRCVEI